MFDLERDTYDWFDECSLQREAIMTLSRLINRNVFAERGRTSMRLEPELWEALSEICTREGQDMSSLVRKIEQRSPGGGRTSAVRVFIVSYFRDPAHAATGHSGEARIESPELPKQTVPMLN
jgi:predicted DNA-binding ribbon-helix-helix protein